MQHYIAEKLSQSLLPEKPFCMSKLYFPSYNLYSLFLALPAIITENNLFSSSLRLSLYIWKFRFSLLLDKMNKAGYFTLPLQITFPRPLLVYSLLDFFQLICIFLEVQCPKLGIYSSLGFISVSESSRLFNKTSQFHVSGCLPFLGCIKRVTLFTCAWLTNRERSPILFCGAALQPGFSILGSCHWLDVPKGRNSAFFSPSPTFYFSASPEYCEPPILPSSQLPNLPA